MNDDRVEGKWKQIRGAFKQKYGKVTDDDTTYSEGKFDEMLGRLQEQTGKTKDELRKEIDKW
ncbi:CsbD family protein [Salegentibacter sp. F188]|uniref:CsbD family protein n=1 Tax=Autumnicola patrickiae TaxID=3075591 RepID=A0ABU3DXL1_9FLAO|nr:CsbD family protein [Salegentibacter sp. F188]MDT0688459.1 CsbD family protein [Salegentibacter sp. F188]